jgi:hypothetical protein
MLESFLLFGGASKAGLETAQAGMQDPKSDENYY